MNPQVVRASTMAPLPANQIPAFLSITGPVREARFVRHPDGTPDGGVYDLFVIAGRVDAPAGCAIRQPDFARELAMHNVVFRIPTPIFGGGLMEAISEASLRANLVSDPDGRKAAFGIEGRFNTTETMAPSCVSAGKPRISLSRSSPVRHTTWKWASPYAEDI